MPDPFFQSQKKRKRNNRSGPSAFRQQKHQNNDEDISSDAEGDNGPVDIDLMDFREGREDVAMSDEEYIDENETAAEKRVRLAKGYLARIQDEVEAGEILLLLLFSTLLILRSQCGPGLRRC